ncbi:MAG: hypothetical protein NZ954_04375 [Thermofilaceae archaeon]|nr:hypothetical protein [Thermofilaceae archaeon]MDW8003236.1 hypothetical protein [Thermofilaceae archaeon]
MRAVKVGGSMLKSAKDYLKYAELAVELDAKVVIVSAMKGITDQLLRATEKRDWSIMREVLTRLEEASAELNNSAKEWLEKGEKLFAAYLDDPTPQRLDELLAIGERVSAALMGEAFKIVGVNAVALDGGSAGIITDNNFGNAKPLLSKSVANIRSNVVPYLRDGSLVVVAGFTGTTFDGRTTTMGRGSSDLTATILARALDVDRLYLVTDTEYLMTGDPGTVLDPRPLKYVGLPEADVMAELSVKRFHPLTFKPIIGSKCRVVIGSQPPRGTVVTDELPPPELKIVTFQKGEVTFVGHGARNHAKTLAEELDLPLVEVKRFHLSFRAPYESNSILRRAHELLLKFYN